MFSGILEACLDWVGKNPQISFPLLLGLLAYLSTALGSRWMRYTVTPFLALLALYFGWRDLARGGDSLVEGFLLTIFGGLAVASAFLMIIQRDPVYTALWFAMVILNTCGLFFLQAAPFLAAATITVYAGAIIVTFLFVIMLAQQTELAPFNQHFRQPVVAGIAGAVFLAALLHAIVVSLPAPTADAQPQPFVAASYPGMSPLSRASAGDKIGGVTDLGRSLFTDYLWGVELAGTLLLVATIGTIIIAHRPREAAT